MFKSVGHLVCVLCRPVPSLHSLDFYEIIFILVVTYTTIGIYLWTAKLAHKVTLAYKPMSKEEFDLSNLETTIRKLNSMYDNEVLVESKFLLHNLTFLFHNLTFTHTHLS